MTTDFPLTKLEEALSDVSIDEIVRDSPDIYLSPSVDAKGYLIRIAENIRRHQCEPFHVSALVMEPGFPWAKPGSVISGQCIAHHPGGYWLVYQPDEDRFYGFWGKDSDHLGAHGIFGTPFYCWTT